MSKVFFRTDGNSHIASGHICRCLSIAYELCDMGSEVTFLLSDAESRCIFEHNLSHMYKGQINCEIIEVGRYDDYTNETRNMADLSEKYGFENGPVVIDSYFVSEDYVEKLRKITKVIYIDDFMNKNYAFDLVINYDVVTENQIDEYRNSYSNSARTLIGGEYAPLRKQFSIYQYNVNEKISNILITTGNTDVYHIEMKFAKFLNKSDASRFILHLVIGMGFDNKDELKRLAMENDNIVIHEGVTDLSKLMQTCDMAISAGGTTLYELCAIGIPTLSFVTADNQINSVVAFDNYGAIKYVGNASMDIDEVVRKAVEYVNTASYDMRLKQSKKMKEVCDGKGAERIAREITREN